MYIKDNGSIVFSPSDLVRFVESPYAVHMDRLNLDKDRGLVPDSFPESAPNIPE